MRKARLVLDSGGIGGYLDSRMVRLWWTRYPMAMGGRMNRRREDMLLFTEDE